jgi:hypothetical protein
MIINKGDTVIMIETCTLWVDGPPFTRGTVGVIDFAGNIYGKLVGREEIFELKKCIKIPNGDLTKLMRVLYDIKEE